jgi:hypothetical protein
MIGSHKIIWDDGVLTDKGKEVAGPGDSVIVDHFKAEEFIQSGKAHSARSPRKGPSRIFTGWSPSKV